MSDKQVKKTIGFKLISKVLRYIVISFFGILLFLYFFPKSSKNEKIILLSSDIRNSIQSLKLTIQLLNELSKNGDLYKVMQCSVNSNQVEKNNKTPVVVPIQHNKNIKSEDILYPFCGQNVSLKIATIDDLDNQSKMITESFNFTVGEEKKEILTKYPHIREMIAQSILNDTNVFNISDPYNADKQINLLYRLDIYSTQKIHFHIPRYILTQKAKSYTIMAEPTCNAIVVIDYKIFDTRNNLLHKTDSLTFNINNRDIPDVIKYLILRMKKDDIINAIFNKEDAMQLVNFDKINKDIISKDAIILEIELRNILK